MVQATIVELIYSITSITTKPRNSLEKVIKPHRSKNPNSLFLLRSREVHPFENENLDGAISSLMFRIFRTYGYINLAVKMLFTDNFSSH
jgi:hypothetical protein